MAAPTKWNKKLQSSLCTFTGSSDVEDQACISHTIIIFLGFTFFILHVKYRSIECFVFHPDSCSCHLLPACCCLVACSCTHAWIKVGRCCADVVTSSASLLVTLPLDQKCFTRLNWLFFCPFCKVCVSSVGAARLLMLVINGVCWLIWASVAKCDSIRWQMRFTEAGASIKVLCLEPNLHTVYRLLEAAKKLEESLIFWLCYKHLI